VQTTLTAVCPLVCLCYNPSLLSSRHIRSLLVETRILSTAPATSHTAVLRDISVGTSYQMVRLVFRPYAHILPASWTSARHWSSSRVSAAFHLYKHSSPSFGSHPHYSCVYIGYSFHLAVYVVSLVRVSIRGGLVRLLLLYFHSS